MTDLSELVAKSNSVDAGSLLAVKERARREMKENPSSQNIAVYNAARKALDAVVRGQETKKVNNESKLASIKEVIRFLETEGYASTTSVYRHRKEGKLKPDADGSFSEAAVLRYAKANLRQMATGLKDSEDAALRQDKLAEAREELIREQTRLARRKREIEEGKWVPKAGVAQDLAMRAVMLKTGLKQLITSSVSDWIHLVGGDPRRAPDLLRAMLEGHERLLSDYARADNITLIIEPATREDQDPGQELPLAQTDEGGCL
jgi:hypothetical protein